MASMIGLKNPEAWNLTKGKLDEVDSWPLMSSPGLILSILTVYLIFVLQFGPSFMLKRQPFKLKSTLVLYNALQVALSLFLVDKYYRHIMKYGFLHSQCLMDDDETRLEVVGAIWWYFIAKVTELLDTVFFVLRKKNTQVTFLHMYHHSIMMFGTWAYLKYAPSDNVIFIGLLNSAVHVIMYTYYGLAALGPEVAKYLTWKKYMTKLQLLQFFSVFVHYFVTLCVSECPPSRAVYSFFMANILMFIILFSNFYYKSYKQKSSALKSISNRMTTCLGPDFVNSKQL